MIKGADISRGQKSEYTFTVTLFICGSVFLDSTNCRWYSTLFLEEKKKITLSGPMQFKCMLFKSELEVKMFVELSVPLLSWLLSPSFPTDSPSTPNSLQPPLPIYILQPPDDVPLSETSSIH